MANPAILTPKGTAIWPALTAPDQFNNIGTRLRIAKGPEADAFRSKLDELQAASVQTLRKEKKNPKLKDRGAPYKIDEDTGDLIVTVRRSFSGTKKDGTPWQMYPLSFFDSKGKKVSAKTLDKMGTGSVLRLSCELSDTVGPPGAGLKLSPKAVQVLKFVKYEGATAEGFGFEADEEGFTVVDAGDDSDEDTFAPSSGGTEGEDGDY